jgi:hypothetical protein
MRSVCAATLAAAALLTVSCGGVVDPSKNVTETFTGTVAVQGTSAGHGFETSKTGEYAIKVTTLSPSSNAFFGTVLAQGLSNGSCETSGLSLPIIQQNSFSTVGTAALQSGIIPGKYCVFLFDIGTFTVPQTYTLTVSHP